jgi:hypothetical protein
MPDDNAFRDLIRPVRAGDQQAAAELVRHYEPVIQLTRAVERVAKRLGLDEVDHE